MTLSVKLMWATPNGDNLVADMARVSNPANQGNEKTAPRLINYLMRNAHWSPFECVNACVEIDTTRDISRQILRHRSFSFQEFSGRYAAYEHLLDYRECRSQDTKNRQNSFVLADDDERRVVWDEMVKEISSKSNDLYKKALELGIAKEVARSILPEGLVPTKLYMNGTMRSWIHYWDLRCDPATQKEHRLVADATKAVILPQYPMLAEAIKQFTSDKI